MTLRDFFRGRKRKGGKAAHPLAGDRCIEWQWVLARLPVRSARVLDVGCANSVTAGYAALSGHDVTGCDINELDYRFLNLRFVQGDIVRAGFDSGSFDYIVLCSTVEHVGLAGRYGSSDESDGDLAAMGVCKRVLKPGGRIALTVPVGVDEVFRPFHRVYGTERLPRLLDGLTILEEEYWRKKEGVWTRVEKQEALGTRGGESHYAIGLYLLGIA